ncbi:caspase family protein [Actinoplanes sp. ATCC 53533]|uniref:caspase family protein n=1 Tax=Actinoplanes sp. ATCC 53533 TaxID=1288362 RepID=UPI001315795C|nr:caspase family protein [Actinoplanes sp. ATCC 53533]
MGRYALLVAASDYEDPYFAQLRSPAQDVRGLAALLRDPMIGGFDVTVLENAPDHQIRRALEDLVAERQSDDLVLVYFSCHGLQDIHGRLHFATTRTRFARPASTAVPAAFVSDQLEHTVAGGRLLLLDCCYSGAFARGFAKSSPRPLDGEIGGSRGYVCLTACNEYELAYEGDHVVLDRPTPSHFTEAVIEGLRTGAADLDGDGWVETGELYRYAYDKVRCAGRQTPSYFATGLQKEIRVARVPGKAGNGIPVAIAATRVTRTPYFFAPRFPPFHFARENRATPTALAEAMAGRPEAAADLFVSEEERCALYDWIDHDVGDRNLERSILRKPPRDHAAAEAAAAIFIATFAPHLHAAFRGWRANAAGLAAIATAAVDGHPDAARIVADIHHHNVLRTLSRHDCSDLGHPCGPGNACGVLLAAASRWDDVLPSARAAIDEVPAAARPTEEAIAAQLLLMILDPVGRELPPHRDMPPWWLRLVLDARVTADGGDARLGPLAVAALTCKAAIAERDEARLALLASAGQDEARSTAPHTAPAKRQDRRRRRRRQRRWLLLAAATLVTSGIVGTSATRTWTNPGFSPEAYSIDGTYLGIDLLVGLLLLTPATIMIIAVRQFWRRRWLDGGSGTVVAFLVIGIVAASLPLIRGRWDGHALQRLTSYAKAHGVLLDSQYRPILSGCATDKLQGVSVVVLVWTKQTADSCRAADVYVNGLPTGRLELPDGSVRKTDDWWITEDSALVTAVIPLWRPASQSWQLIGLSVRAPNLALWTVSVRPNLAGTAQLKAIHRNDLLFLEAESGVYIVDMHTGRERAAQGCPKGQPFDGLGPVSPHNVGILCGKDVISVSG